MQEFRQTGCVAINIAILKSNNINKITLVVVRIPTNRLSYVTINIIILKPNSNLCYQLGFLFVPFDRKRDYSWNPLLDTSFITNGFTPKAFTPPYEKLAGLPLPNFGSTAPRSCYSYLQVFHKTM